MVEDYEMGQEHRFYEVLVGLGGLEPVVDHLG